MEAPHVGLQLIRVLEKFPIVRLFLDFRLLAAIITVRALRERA